MTVERQVDPNEPAYFGPPSPAIDAAWKDLLRGEFFVMTAAEAAPFEPDLRPFAKDGKRRMELRVTHDLHCLNAVRRALDRDYYGDYHGAQLRAGPRRPLPASPDAQPHVPRRPHAGAAVHVAALPHRAGPRRHPHVPRLERHSRVVRRAESRWVGDGPGIGQWWRGREGTRRWMLCRRICLEATASDVLVES